MSEPEKNEKVREAIKMVIEHLDSEWGFCEDDEYSFGCASCEAGRLRKQLESIADFLD